MLVRLLYCSRAAGEPKSDTVCEIMRQSHAYNPAHGITGILCHSERVYMQVLEGGREEITLLYAKIVRDPRHTDVVLLHYEEINERRYAGWTMGKANLARINASTLLRFSDLPGLNPHSMSGKNSLALVDELMASASVVGHP